ncbi:hypothetical protein [Rhodococcoides fascians]|uniref:hypothetical protein n=1 Tax=Rhodococcoides fascians TaxID=1828 RepID=UPI0006899CE8|nr:hypothetical protein [Rhodococcus fascians]
MNTELTTRTAFAATAAALVVALSGCGASGESTNTDTEPAIAGTYANGTFSADGVYGGAPSYMTIDLTLSDNIITDVEVIPMPENNDTSRGYQERFASAVPDAVIGLSIDDADVDTLAGASGCADGFNNALALIRSQASTSS